MNDWLTIAEAGKKTGIPDRTIRRYISQHGSHFLTRKQHRSYLVAPDALPTLAQIRDYYAAGWDAEKVEEALAKSGVPMTITMAEDDDRVAVTVAGALTDLRRAVAEAIASMADEQRRMAQELEVLRQELAVTKELLEKQDGERRMAEAESHRLLEERDRQLMEEIRRVLQEKRKPWWKFW